MLNTLTKNLNLCFIKLKPTPTLDQSPPSINPLHLNRPSYPTFIKNFNSLFNQTNSDHDSDDSDTIPATPDIATAIASRRFFFSSPGRSNSIIDSSLPSSSTSSIAEGSIEASPEDMVAVPTNSPDPYGDFKRSMEEMVEARGLHDVRESWEQLHELLTCYLTLNPKCTHKIIFAAFADLLVSLMSNVM